MLPRSKLQIQLPPPISDTGYRVRVRTLVVDSTKTTPTDTIDDIYSGTDEEIVSKLLYQSESAASVYDFGDPDNYVAYLDVSDDSGATTHPQDAVFAFDTTAGEMIESVRYDTEAGIAYIPRSVFENQRMSELVPEQSELQAQMLVRCDPALIQQAYTEDSQADAIGDEDPLGETSSAMKVPVEISSDSGKVSKMSNVPIVGNQFAINVTAPVDASKIALNCFEVSINDGAITLDGNEDIYGAGSNKPSLSYNAETGDLNIHNVSSASVMNMSVHMSAFVSPSMSSRAALATAGKIKNATDKAYKVGHYGVANCTGGYGEDGAATKTIRRWAPGQFVQKFSDISKNHIVDETCAYVIAIGKCPSALGSSWTADVSKKWQANCVHISYPSGENPPSTGYYKVLAADWNNQTVTIAFFVTCDSSGQEGGMVLTFDAPRTTEYTLHKKANANTAQKGILSSNVGGAVFGVYSSKAAAQEGGSKGLVKKITTNDRGIAQADFEEGKYYVRELSAPWPYLVSDQILTFMAKPKSDVKATMYEDSVPPIEIRKKILPSALSYSEADVKSGGNVLLHVKTTVADNGRDIATEVRAISDVSNISVRNSSTSVLSNPSSADSRFNAASSVISSMRTGDTLTLVQSVKTGEGWSNSASFAGICSVSTGGATASMSLPLLKASLEGVRYGIYHDSSCSKKVGETTLNKNGVGKYGTKPGEKLKSNTRYYLREIAGANGYTVSSEVYSVTTSRNSQVSVNVSDSFSTIILTKQNSAGDSFTGIFPQFKLAGARYGIFDDRSAAEQRDESKVVRTSEGNAAIIKTDAAGKATTVSVGAGTYYVAELPSNITCVQSATPNNPSPSDIESSIAAHDYTSKPNGKFLLDEQIHEVRLQPGKTSFVISNEKVPVKIQLSKQSLKPDLSSLSQFSIEGAVFGVYGTESAARAAQISSNYGKPGDDVSAAGAVAVLYGSKSGLTTVSGELPLQDYWIKEIRAPRNYKALGESMWALNNRTINSEILHVSASDFISSGRFIDGMIASPSIIKSNQPEDVTVQVHKDASEVPDEMKNTGNAMSLAGARFAIYRTYDDARQDTNRLSFKTDDQPTSDSTKTELLTTRADGWSNKAVGLPAEECYWVREIEPPHMISSDPTENENNIAESMYLLNEEPMKTSFSEPLSVDMLASQDEQVKPISITVGKYPMSIDPEGRNLHVGEKDANGIPYNDAYTDSALEGAVFALFDTHDQAANAMVTDDVSDLSVEQAAWDAGAIAVMTSDANGICGTIDNLKWKPDGYYLRELKAPNSGCYKRNTEILLVSCDKNTLDSEHIRLHVDEDKISKFFELDEAPNYYYVKIEKTSTDPSVLADTSNYDLEGIHFGIYKTYDEAAAATEEQPGSPMYNLYTKEATHDDGTIHYEATTGLTGPGVFWAKELIAENAPSNGFEKLTLPIRVEAKLGGIPRYDTTPITPENSSPTFDENGKLSYKTAKDIDEELGNETRSFNKKSTAKLGTLVMPIGAMLPQPMMAAATKNYQKTNSNSEWGGNIPSVYVKNSTDVTFLVSDDGPVAEEVGFSPWAAIRKTDGTNTWQSAVLPRHSSFHSKICGISDYNYWKGISTLTSKHGGLTKEMDTHFYFTRTDAWCGTTPGTDFSLAKWHYYPQIKITYSLNGGTGTKPSTTEKLLGHEATLASNADFSRTGYTFYGWNRNKTSNQALYKSSQKIGYFDWNILEQVQYSPKRETDSNKTGMTVKIGCANPAKTRILSLYAVWQANSYTVSFNANGGSNVSSARTVTYDAAMPAATVPTRTGYIFQGYYDATTGGTQYYKADGTSAHTWNKASNATLYAHWTPITYKVRFTADNPPTNPASPGVSGSAVEVTCTYGTTYKTQGVLFHKFGHAMTAWACGSTSYAPNSNFSNLTATNGATVVMRAIWAEKKYFVKYHDGLATQFGPAPVVATGWTSGYQCSLWYDDYAGDGQSCDTLEPIHYSHPYFVFKYWTDTPNGNGNKYSDRQAVYNLALPDQAKELYGVWTPSFDYGIDCEPNIIPNQPIGGITVQKSIMGNREASAVYGDLSGIAFQLFSDSSCTQLVSTSHTDKNGLAFFAGLETGKTYYVKEDSIPSRLSGIMSKSDDTIEVTPGADASYTFENEGKQLSIDLVKRPSQDAIETIAPEILSSMPPTNAKFAIYATEQDARNDANRLQFTDENGRQTNIATVRTVSNGDGIPIASTNISGLPKQDLWVMELAAPSIAGHKYVPISSPIFVAADKNETNTGTALRVEVPNDVDIISEVEMSKTIDQADLDDIPSALHKDVQSLTDGIVYALYTDKADAAKRAGNHAKFIEFANGTATVSNLPRGTYYLIEWSLPKAVEEAGISMSDKVVTIKVAAVQDDSGTELIDSFAPKRMHIKKVDAETQEPIAGVVFDIYTDDTKQELLCSTSKTDAQGVSVSESALLAGRSYFVQERYDSLPPEYNGGGVGTDKTWSGWVKLELASTADDTYVVENDKNNETGSIEVRKASNTGVSTTGAVFSVYDATGMFYGQMTTENGYARMDSVPVGTYTVKEKSALPMHSLTPDGSEPEEFEGTVLPDECWSVNDGEPIENFQGHVRVHKESASPEITDALPEIYSLAGAIYSLYPIIDGVASASPLPVTLTTDDKGETETIAVPLGSYKVVETAEPANFDTLPENKEFVIDVTMESANAEHAVVVESADYPATEPLTNLLVEKRSAETLAESDGSPQGATSMANTKFAIEYSDKLASTYGEAISLAKSKRWVITTDEEGRATFDADCIVEEESDEPFRDSEGNTVLPVGTIVVREVQPPVGYALGDAPAAAYRFSGESGRFEEMFADGVSDRIWNGAPTFTAANDIHRTDISFHKIDAFDADKTMSQIPFALSLLDSEGRVIERHLIATDDRGSYSSAVGSVKVVNENDQWLPGDVEEGCVAEDFAPVDSRVWFSGSQAEVTPSSEKGALIYGDYELREYYKAGTEHYQNLEPIRFSVRGDENGSWIEMDGKKVEGTDITQGMIEIKNHSVHIVSTSFTDKVSTTHVMADGSLLATESVKYADATAGETYVFETYAYDADTKEPIVKQIVDIDGTIVEAQAGSSCTIVAEDASEHVAIDVSFDGYDVANRKIGLVTEVYHNGYLSDRHNADLTDDAEAVSFASIGTTATDFDTSQHIGISDGHIDLIDIIRYENLVPDTEYTVKGILMDKVTKTALHDASGNTIEAVRTFTPDARNGEVELRFSFAMNPGEAFAAVAFEEVLVSGEIVAEHKDIEDEDQSVTYPSISTTARDKLTGAAMGNPEHDRIGIIDTVAFDNLIPEHEYEMRGVLYTLDGDGNKTVIEGTQTTSNFTAKAASGVAKMAFECDALAVAGKRVLVGEEIWSEGKIVARHDDAAFSDQVVSYPSVATTATDIVSGLHIGNGESARQIKDIVHLEGLKVGESYRIDGTVMARSTNGAVASTQVTATKMFTATASIEDHVLIFDLSADFPERDAVVFEKLLSADGAHVIATHEDGSNEGQTVHYPRIGTLALHPNGGTHVGSNIDNKICDTVAYENLVLGYEYELVGMLVNKATGEFVSNPEGTAPITSSARFSPDAANGSIDIPFDLAGVDVQGKTLVVFENLFVVNKEALSNGSESDGRSLVATHCDIDADKQTMFYPALFTTARDAATGTHVGSSLAEAVIIDRIEYKNLVVGYEYEVSGTLMDKDSGETITIDGKPVQSSVKFKPSSADGFVELTFDSIPTEISKDKTFVAFEKLLFANVEMARHEDLSDKEQSVSYPTIHTTATDAKTKLHEGNITSSADSGASSIEDGKITIIDRVEYTNLVAGKNYKIVGTLMDKAKAAPVAEASAEFVVEAENGHVDVAFEVEVSKTQGHVFVAFEKLLDDAGHEIANHEDMDDEAQTVSYPKIETIAIDKRTQTHSGSCESISIVDTVRYEGLIEEHSYIMSGVLMDKSSNQPVVDGEGKIVQAEQQFISGAGGAGEVIIDFDASVPNEEWLAGKTFVAFERLEAVAESNDENDDNGDSSGTPDEKRTVIAVHEDIEDEAQTIHYVKITRTLARADDGSKTLARSNAAIMSDTVKYENAVPGTEYTLEASMMDKSSEDVAVAAGKAVTSSVTFTAKASQGEEKVPFELDSTTGEIGEVVVFEHMKVNNALVAKHTDINSEDQSIHGVADDLVDTGLADDLISNTSDAVWWLLIIFGCMFASVSGIMIMRLRQQKK